jgi:hypothetical protein
MDLENQFEKKTSFSHSLTHLRPAGPVSRRPACLFPPARAPFSSPPSSLLAGPAQSANGSRCRASFPPVADSRVHLSAPPSSPTPSSARGCSVMGNRPACAHAPHRGSVPCAPASIKRRPAPDATPPLPLPVPFLLSEPHSPCGCDQPRSTTWTAALTPSPAPFLPW